MISERQALRFSIAFLVASLSACTGALQEEQAKGRRTSSPSRGAYQIPFAFVENRGQWKPEARFAATLGGVNVLVGRQGFELRTPARDAEPPILMRFTDADDHVEIRGEKPLSATFNYFLGSNSTEWQIGVPAYEAVRYEGIYPGVDLRLRKAGGRLEYDLLLDRGAPLDGIEICCDGARTLTVDRTGALVVAFDGGEIRHLPPISWEEAPDGSRRPLRVAYRILSADSFGFVAENRNADHLLVIDPGLDWASYLGGSSFDFILDAALDASGAVTVVGETSASDFPATNGAYDTTYNGSGPPTSDVFVARFDATGSALIYATYLGGTSGDKPYGVAVDGQGTATVVGNCGSGFPTTAGAWDTTLSGSSDAFVSRLTPNGTSLVFSSYLGGGSGDVANAVALGSDDEPVVVGVTSSSDFFVSPGAFDSGASGQSDVFVTRFNSTGSGLVYSSRLGGNDGDVGTAVDVLPAGDPVVVGVTSSTDFPTTAGAFDASLGGRSDAFAARLNASGTALVYATLLGGSKGDVAEAVAVEGSGAAVVAGVTSSSDFSVVGGGLDAGGGGASDAFAAKLRPDGTGLIFSSLVGGSRGDVPKGVLLDKSGAIVVAGQTSSTNFPTTPGAYDSSAGGSADAFVYQLSPDGSSLLYSSYYGGSGSDGGEGLTGDGAALAVVVGVAGSGDLPTPGGFDGSLSGSGDGFVAALDIAACGFETYGLSTPACSGNIAIGVTSCPTSGNADFGVASTNSPPLAAGALVFGAGADLPGTAMLGILVHLDLDLPIIALPTMSDSSGMAKVTIPLSSIPPGRRGYFQYVWINTPECPALDPFSASNGLAVVVL